MSKHILNTFRKFVLSAAFKALPLRSARLVQPQPIKNPYEPEADVWLFEPTRPVASHMADLASEMGRLTGSLGKLHTIVSVISAQAPLQYAVKSVPAFGALWSDDVLFDGEPMMTACDSQMTAEGHADFLFDEIVMPVEGAVRLQAEMSAAY